jgi:hypothetical protein
MSRHILPTAIYGHTDRSLIPSLESRNLHNGKVRTNGSKLASHSPKYARRSPESTTQTSITSARPLRLPPPPRRKKQPASQDLEQDAILPNPPPLSLESESPRLEPVDTREPKFNRHTSYEPVALVAEGGSTNELLKAVLQERGKIIDIRTSIRAQQQDLEAQLPLDRNAYASMINSLKSAMPDILSSNISFDTRVLLGQQWSRFEQLSATLDIWQRRLEREQDDLWRRESKLMIKEEELYKRLHSIDPRSSIDLADLRSESFIPTTLLRPSSRLSHSSCSTNPDERQYYRIIQDINLLREEIFNLESDFRLQQIERDELADPSIVHKLTDEEFFASYFQAREAIVQEYFEAKTTMECVAQECHEKGIEVEPPNLPPFLDHVFNEDGDIFIHHTDKESNAARKGDAQIIRWIKDVLRSSLPKSVDLADTLITKLESEGTHNKLRFHRGPPQPVFEAPFSGEMFTRVLRRNQSFQGEFKGNRRRYSTPEMSSVFAPESGSTDDQNLVSPNSCKICLQNRRPQSAIQ